MATWTPATKNASTFANPSKSGLSDFFLKIGDGFLLSIGNGYHLKISEKTSWIDGGKNASSWTNANKN